MKILVLSFLIVFFYWCNVAAQAKKTSLEILDIPCYEHDFPGEAYEDILKEKNPEKKLKDILLKIPIVFEDICGGFDLNYHINASLATLYRYSKKHKISNEFVPILIDFLDRNWYTFENTLDNAKLIKKITNIDVGWDESYVKKMSEKRWSDKDYADRKEKIAKWKQWVIDNKVRDMIKNRLLPVPQKKDPILINDLLKLENSEDLIQAYTNLAYDSDAENKIVGIIVWLYKEDDTKSFLHLFYALEALSRYSQNHPILSNIDSLLINRLKNFYGTFSQQNACASLLKNISKVDVGWEYDYYKFRSNMDKSHKEREAQIKKWEDWFNRKK